MPPPRLLIKYNSFKTIKYNLPTFIHIWCACNCYCTLASFLSHDYFSYIHVGSLVVFFINFMFSSDEGAYARNVRPRVFYSVSSVYTNFIYFDLYQNMAGRLELVETVYIMIPNACLLDKMHVGFWCSRFRCFWFLWCLLVVGIKRIIFPMSHIFGKKRSKP